MERIAENTVDRGSIFSKFIFNFIKTFSGIVFPVVTFTYASRILGQEGIGKVQFSKSIITFLSMLAMLGMNYYGTREGAKLRDNRNELSRFAHEMLFINGIATMGSYLLLFLALVFVPKLADYRMLLVINSAAIILQGMGMEWLYQAVEEYRYIAIRSVVFQFISLTALFVFVKDTGDSVAYAVICLISSSGSYILNFFNARKFIDFHWCGHYKIRQHIVPILWLFVMVFSIEMFTVLDSTMLGFLKNDAAVGRYTAAVKVNRLVNTLIYSLSMVLIPRLSYYIGVRENEKVREIVNKAYNYVFMLSVPAAIGLFMLADDIILLFSGRDFISAGFTMRLLTPIVLLIPFSVSTNQQTLIPMGHEKRILISTTVGAALNFLFNLVLIPRYAENGAAVATVISEAGVFAVSLYNASCFFDMKYNFRKYYQYWIAAMPIPLIAVIVAQWEFSSVTRMAIVITTSVVLYFAILLVLKNEYLQQVFLILTGKMRKWESKK